MTEIVEAELGTRCSHCLKLALYCDLNPELEAEDSYFCKEHFEDEYRGVDTVDA